MTWTSKPSGVARLPSSELPGERLGTRPAPDLRFSSGRWRIALCALLLAALMASRAPVAPRHLITFDEINFALSIRQFNPAAHQPQPPGYPLFVGLLKLLSLAIPKVETVFFAAALLMSLISLALLWTLGERMLPAGWGMVAALLLLWNPPFWYGAVTNPVRLGLSAGSTGVALCLFVALLRRSGGWFIAATGLLALAAGFRPTLLVVMAPLLAWTAFSLRVNRRIVAASALAFAFGIALWLPFLAGVAGGLLPLYHLLTGYAHDQTRATSALMGAPASAAIHMALQAVEWSCLGTLSWIWAVPSAVRREPAMLRATRTNRFLLLWFLSALVFSAIFHVGDPDQTLAIVPPTCLFGARVLSCFRAGSLRSRALLVTAAALLNIFLFFKPITKIAKASTYPTVSWLDGYITALIDGASGLGRDSDATIVFPPGVAGWRNVSYYAPGVSMLVVGDPGQGSTAVFQIQAGRGQSFSRSSSAIPIPACGPIAVVDPGTPAWEAPGPPAGLFRDHYYIWRFASAPGISFRSHGVRFVAGETPCRSIP